MMDFCVLGSGLSGSRIASLLNKNYSVEIFDKAKGIGGRSSNKKLNKLISFDHGLQYYSPKDNQFRNFLKKLIKQKVLKIWEGNHLDFTFKKKMNYQKIIGVKGNNDLNKYLIKNIKKKLNEEIVRIKFKEKYWEISGKNDKFFSKNLIITFPFNQTKKIAKRYLDTNFLNQNIKMTPNITLLVKQKTNKKIPISSIKLRNKIISWAASENSKKRFFSKDNYWTVQTSENYSKKIINLYKKNRNYYSNQIIKEFSNILNIKSKRFKLFKLHGWKYSYNKYKTNRECLWNKKYQIGICGDWFIGPNAEASWRSAVALYKKIKKNPPNKFRRV